MPLVRRPFSGGGERKLGKESAQGLGTSNFGLSRISDEKISGLLLTATFPGRFANAAWMSAVEPSSSCALMHSAAPKESSRRIISGSRQPAAWVQPWSVRGQPQKEQTRGGRMKHSFIAVAAGVDTSCQMQSPPPRHRLITGLCARCWLPANACASRARPGCREGPCSPSEAR